MTCRIETDAQGRETIVTDSADNAGTNSKITGQGLPADSVFIRLSDGACFTKTPPLNRLSPAEVDMVNHFIEEKGAPQPDVFAGDPPA